MVNVHLLKTILNQIHEKFSNIFKTALKRDIKEVSEQTVLASIVLIFDHHHNNQIDNDDNINNNEMKTNEQTFEIISIANGTKSLGKKNMSNQGNLINDSHAEVLVRRAFKKFILDNLNNTKYFIKNNDNDKYIKQFKVLFYTSQTPCGQASIVKQQSQQLLQEINLEQSIHNQSNEQDNKEQQCCQNENKQEQNQQKQQLFQNTGAKYYNFIYDEKYNEDKDKEQNILRIKPGRTDLQQDQRSQSLSCTDKILNWNILGLQGSIIGLLLDQPIYIDYMFIESDGQNTYEFKEQIKQGIFIDKRFKEQYKQKQLQQKILKKQKKVISKNYIFKKPFVIVTKKYFFPLNRSLSNNKPKYLDQHIVYLKSCNVSNNVAGVSNVKDDFVEIINGSNGMKWGMGEKGSVIKKNYPFICKYNLFQNFSQIKHMSSNHSYHEIKKQSIKYQLIKSNILKLFKEKIVDKQNYNSFYLN